MRQVVELPGSLITKQKNKNLFCGVLAPADKQLKTEAAAPPTKTRAAAARHPHPPRHKKHQIMQPKQPR